VTTRAPKLILASASPRRSELLKQMVVRFEVVTADVEEIGGSDGWSPEEVAIENAGLKARAVASRHPERWVLGADTVVALGERLFGKPASREEAAMFLREMAGKTHEVITGCALIAPDGAMDLFHDVTKVTFRPLTDETITRYLDAVHVLDKAGAYALQEQGELIVESVAGSESNVIGLPVERLGRVLDKYGLR
jgi:septum formation protein